MKIPNDTGGNWRLNKFIEYSSVVPSINPVTIANYALLKNLSPSDCIYLAWLVSVTYSAETAIFIYNELPYKNIASESSDFWNSNKDNLIFIPPKHYIRINDLFEGLLISFYKTTKGNPELFLKNNCTSLNPNKNFLKLQNIFQGIKNCGRFGVEEFLYCITRLNECNLLKLNMDHPPVIDWKNGANVTTGLLNIFYHDEIADTIDCKTCNFLNEKHYKYLNSRLFYIKKKIKAKYPFINNDISLFQGKICSFRNLFKGRRYAGFHHDRQLETIYKYRDLYPNSNVWDELLNLRKLTFQKQILGELNNWDGVRKDLKKSFIKEGKTMAEGIPVFIQKRKVR